MNGRFHNNIQIPLNPSLTGAEDVIASRLAHLTRQEGASPLLGGDLESALSVLRSVANRLAYRLQQETTLYNARSHVVQIYQVRLGCVVWLLYRVTMQCGHYTG